MPLGAALNRYVNQLRRLLAIPEESPFELDDTVQAVFLLERPGPELAFLRGEKLCAMTFSDGAVALQFSHIWLRNPTGSGTLAILEDLTLDIGGIDGALFGITLNTALPAADAETAGWSRDLRGWTPGTGHVRSVCVPANYTNAVGALGTSMGFIRKTIAESYYQPLDFVLPPGMAFVVRTNVVNNELNVSMRWRERALGRYEL